MYQVLWLKMIGPHWQKPVLLLSALASKTKQLVLFIRSPTFPHWNMSYIMRSANALLIYGLFIVYKHMNGEDVKTLEIMQLCKAETDKQGENGRKKTPAVTKMMNHTVCSKAKTINVIKIKPFSWFCPCFSHYFLTRFCCTQTLKRKKLKTCSVSHSHPHSSNTLPAKHFKSLSSVTHRSVWGFAGPRLLILQRRSIQRSFAVMREDNLRQIIPGIH